MNWSWMSLLNINILMLAVLHLTSSAHRLFLLYLRRMLLLHIHGFVSIDIYALPADVEVALPAVVELVGVLAAEMALSLTLEGSKLELMLIITSLKHDGLAFETVAYTFLLTVVASKLYYLLFFALTALCVPILRASQVNKHVILLTLCDDWSLLVCRYPSTVLHTLPTQSCLAGSIIAILIFYGSATHTPKLLLFLSKFYISQSTDLNLMIRSASPIKVDIHEFAAEAEVFLAVGAHLRALFELVAQRASVAMMDYVHIS